MPEPEANPAPSVARRHRDPALLAAAVIAVGLGLGVGAGSVFGDTGTTASVSDAAFPGVIGGIVGALAGVLALGMIRALSVRHWPTLRPFAITVVVCTLGLGVLSGVSMAPSEPVQRVGRLRWGDHGDPDGFRRSRGCGRARRP